MIADVSLGDVNSTGFLADVAYIGTDVVMAGYELLTEGTEEQLLVSRANAAGSVWNYTKSGGSGTRSFATALAVSGGEIAVSGSAGTGTDLDIYSLRVDASLGTPVGALSTTKARAAHATTAQPSNLTAQAAFLWLAR